MIPHVTQFDEADITRLEKFRVALNKEQEKNGIKVTVLAFLIKAGVDALKKFPMFNSSLDGENLIVKHYYHIGFAADTPNGLVVPVIRDADKKTLLEIAREAGELAAKARDGKLAPAEMQGGCFTISSLGGIGGTAFTPIINAPEVAILGVSRADTEAEMGWQAVCAAPDAAAVAVLRPPRGRWRRGDALYCAPRTGAGRHARNAVGHGCARRQEAGGQAQGAQACEKIEAALTV